MRRDYQITDFAFSRVGPTHTPLRLVLHTDGNPNPHTGLSSLKWGESSGAFTIHWYIDDAIAYRAIPEDRHAFHVLEPRIAEEKGYTVWYGNQKRGDIGAIGIEHKMEPDGSWSQETRITSVLLGADILRRHPNIAVSEHAEWDPWTRANDVGDALYIPDWLADVNDVIAGKTPYRTVGPTANGSAYTGPVPIEETTMTDQQIRDLIDAAIKGQVLDPLAAWQNGPLETRLKAIESKPAGDHKHYGTNTGGVVR